MNARKWIVRLTLSPLICAAVVFSTAMDIWSEKVRITGNNVSVRSEPKSIAEILKQVNAGDEFESVPPDDGLWVRIVPPEDVSFWINNKLLEDSVVNVVKAQIRSGAGLNYSVVGQVERGTEVVERDRLGDWVKIAPPEGCYVWISKRYVEVVPPPAPEPDPEPEVEPMAESSSESEACSSLEVAADVQEVETLSESSSDDVDNEDIVGPPLPPSGRTAFTPDGRRRTSADRLTPDGINRDKLTSGAEQGKLGRYTGQLVRTGATSTSPSRYRLVARERGTQYTVCFVLGKNDQLDKLLDRQMTVEGPVYWFRYNQDPAVLAEQILLKK